MVSIGGDTTTATMKACAFCGICTRIIPTVTSISILDSYIFYRYCLHLLIAKMREPKPGITHTVPLTNTTPTPRPMRITHVEARDIRFPTSRMLDGWDAVNVDPDYSAAYVTLHTDQNGLEGNGLAFTCGRGTEIVVAMIRALAPLVEGLTLDEIREDMLGFWRRLTSDSQMRWLGPEKGVIHLARRPLPMPYGTCWPRCDEKPLWQYLSICLWNAGGVYRFRYVTDLITPEEATYMLRSLEPSRASRLHRLRKNGYPAYTTSAGRLGYSDEKLCNLCRKGVAQGWTRFKQKVGANIEDDRRRARIIREEIGGRTAS